MMQQRTGPEHISAKGTDVTQQDLIQELRAPDQRGTGRIDPAPTGPRNVDRLAEMDKRSIRIRMWDYFLVPGVLQIPDYSRSVIRSAYPHMSSIDLERRVMVKQSRAEAFLRRSKRLVTGMAWVVVGEHAITHPMTDDPEMHRRQLRALIALSRQSGITLQVVPETTAVPALHPSFALYDLDDESRVGYVESIMGAFYSTRDEHIQDMHIAFSDLRHMGLMPEASRRFIWEVMESWRELRWESPASTTESASPSPTTQQPETTASE